MSRLREFSQAFARALFKTEDKAMMATSEGGRAMKLVGWIRAQESDRAHLRDTFGVTGKMIYNEGMQCFEYCTLDSMEAVEKLRREWPGFFAAAFTALDDDGNQLPRDEQPCWGFYSIDEANQTHDWITGVELPWCNVCGLSKISAHIWGDGDWTKNPIPCLGQPGIPREGE